jgi:hypothetical protein
MLSSLASSYASRTIARLALARSISVTVPSSTANTVASLWI